MTTQESRPTDVQALARPRLCRKCRWARPYWPVLLASLGLDWQTYWQNARCMHPSARVDTTAQRKADLLVAGASKTRPTAQRFCTIYREIESGYGEMGRFWEPRR